MIVVERLLHDPRTAMWSHRAVGIATVLGWIAIAAIIASLYVGHASSPYDTCAAVTGRSVSCDALHHRSVKDAHRGAGAP